MKKWLPNISDFGLEKIISADMLNYSGNQFSSLGLRGTIGYAPPEYGIGSELSMKSDVYSYGILLLEILTGKRPTSEKFKEGESLHNFVKEVFPERVTDIIDPIVLGKSIRKGTIGDISLSRNNLVNNRHLQCLNSTLETGLTCSSNSPSEQIDMSNVVNKLCSIRDELQQTQSRQVQIKYAA
ncbi:probable LRR receptor-like serine/threonine-protein kinase At3g47570 [Hibiscus syriacus]|uniref:probable LRR receptor-like serine/threonine-protein kinase At3g47570 n=1 Tax=Hibiscus syriacus TaxID=106335 RepID=UPI001921D3F6|nr:probable LRR receptor-like serine/threonine-protein kinase At3g47570 [Hibiscus syriacus]